MDRLLTFSVYFGLLAYVFVACFRQPAIAAGAMLLTFGVEQWAQSRETFFVNQQVLTNFAFGGLMLWAVGLKWVREGSLLQPWPAVGSVTLLMIAWMSFSLIWTRAPQPQVDHFWNDMLYFAAFGPLLALSITSLRDLRAALYFLLAVGAVLITVIFLTTGFTGRSISFQVDKIGFGAKYFATGNPLAIATLAGQVALVALLLNHRGAARVWQVLRWGVIAVAIATTFRTESRGQLVAMVMAALFLLPASRRLAHARGFFGAIIAGGLFVFVTSQLFDALTAEQGKRWDYDTFVATYQGTRLNTALQVLGHWIDAGPITWLIGMGWSASYDPFVLGAYPHLVMGEVLAELGVVGFVLLWFIPVLGFGYAYRLNRLVRDDPESRGLVAAMAGLLLFDIILSFKQGNLIGNGPAFGFAIVLGRLCLTHESLAERGYDPTLAGTGEAGGPGLVGAALPDDGEHGFAEPALARADDRAHDWMDEAAEHAILAAQGRVSGSMRMPERYAENLN